MRALLKGITSRQLLHEIHHLLRFHILMADDYRLDSKKNIVFSTEHGPAGGDEININFSPGKIIENFGWPISSYGEHYKKNYSEKILSLIHI